MRKTLLLMMAALLLLLTACDIPPEVFRDDDEVMTGAVEGLLASVRAGDMEAVQRAFAPALQGDELTAQLHALAALLPEGEPVLLWGSGTMASRSSHAGEQVWSLTKSFTYSFGGQVICVFARLCTYDTAEPDNVGFSSVYVVRGEDCPTYETLHYWRAGGLPGLHLESSVAAE